MLAELYGKQTGASKGFGGSMHLFDRDTNFLGGHGIVGGHIPIAAGVLYPAFGVLLSPIVAALAMALSSVSVIANSLRLRKLKL